MTFATEGSISTPLFEKPFDSYKFKNGETYQVAIQNPYEASRFDDSIKDSMQWKSATAVFTAQATARCLSQTAQ